MADDYLKWHRLSVPVTITFTLAHSDILSLGKDVYEKSIIIRRLLDHHGIKEQGN